MLLSGNISTGASLAYIILHGGLQLEYNQYLGSSLSVKRVIDCPFSRGLLHCRIKPTCDISGIPGTPSEEKPTCVQHMNRKLKIHTRSSKVY